MGDGEAGLLPDIGHPVREGGQLGLCSCPPPARDRAMVDGAMVDGAGRRGLRRLTPCMEYLWDFKGFGLGTGGWRVGAGD